MKQVFVSYRLPKHVFKTEKLGDRYDWTTGGPYNGNEWKKYRVVPRAYPLRPLIYAYFNRSGSNGAFSTWDHFRCTVEPWPSVEKLVPLHRVSFWKGSEKKLLP